MYYHGPEDVDVVEKREVDWPDEREGAELVGVSTEGSPYYYEGEAGTVLEGAPKEDGEPIVYEASGGLASFFEEIEDEVETLTERAQEIFEEEAEESTEPDETDGSRESGE